MADGEPARATLTWRGTVEGARRIAPVAVAGIAFGAAFGVAAVQAGVPGWLAVLMSATVFAAASQFLALELWAGPAAALLLAVLAVNARHLMLGAAMHPWLASRPPGERHLVAALISDVNWALAMRGYGEGERDLGLLVGSGLLLWAAWVAGTAIGALAGAVLGDPRRLGLDAMLPVFLAVMLVGMWRGRRTAWPWGAAGLVGSLTVALPGSLHVLAGGLAGGLIGALRRRERGS
jgi:predicted branched-subunit amino acid permease